MEKQLRMKVANTIKGWHGAKMGSDIHKKIIDTYNSQISLPRGFKMTYSAPWCAATVSSAFLANNLADIMPTECSCNEMIILCQQQGIWVENDAYVPKVGDVIFYDLDDTGKGDNTGQADHVGLVTDVVGKTIHVEEGNKSKAVGERLLKINGRYIRGYAVPNYASKADSESEPITLSTTVSKGGTCMIELNELKKGSKSNQVKNLQILLNAKLEKVKGYVKLLVDGDFQSKTEAAVRLYQKLYGLYIDGIVFEKTWTSLLK